MELKRQLGLRTATALVVGEVIAVGIFLTPAGMAKSLGSPALVLLVWLVMGAMALFGALCYGELAARYPEAGGGYVYLREAYGPVLAFMYGWMALLVMDPGLTAALAVGLASYAGYSLSLSPVGTKVLGIGVILMLAALNIRGVKLGGGVVRWLTVIKLGFLAFVLLWGFGSQRGNWTHFSPFLGHPSQSLPFAQLAAGLIGAFFSFGGWWDMSKLAGEVREPNYTLPRAMAFGVMIVTLVYILTSAVFIYLVAPDQVTSGETFAAQAGEVLFGRSGGQVFSLIVIVSVLGSMAAVVISAPRVYYAMAQDGLFFPGAAALHPRWGTPARAIALQAVLASVLVVFSNFQNIVAYFFFVVVVFLALSVAAIFVLRRKGSATTYLTPGYPLTPIVFLVMVTLVLILLAAGDPRHSFLGVAMVALGAPVYYLFVRPKSLANQASRSETT
ncbi:MAG TPA: amino acid permease [Pyrinomonadaceae bacterium]|nr:amino acid permease [Pyrinomonadaceae bacterium]